MRFDASDPSGTGEPASPGTAQMLLQAAHAHTEVSKRSRCSHMQCIRVCAQAGVSDSFRCFHLLCIKVKFAVHAGISGISLR